LAASGPGVAKKKKKKKKKKKVSQQEIEKKGEKKERISCFLAKPLHAATEGSTGGKETEKKRIETNHTVSVVEPYGEGRGGKSRPSGNSRMNPDAEKP